jgi:sugar phosphate permease
LLIGGMAATVLSTCAAGALVGPGRARYVLLLAAMALQGLTQATGWASNVALMTNWTRKVERGRVMALWSTCYQLGSVFAKSFAAFVFGWLGLAWSFWGAAIVLAGVTFLFAALARESPEAAGFPGLEAASSATASPAAAESSPRVDPAQGDAAILRRIIALGFIYFSFKFVRYALDSWSALLAAEHFHTTTMIAGYLSTTFDWVGFLGVLAAGWASDRIFAGRRSPVIFVMTIGCFLATVLLWVVGLSSLMLYAALLGLVGFLTMGPDALLSGACAMDVGTRQQAAFAAAMINGLGAIGPIFEEPVIGWAKTYHGLHAVFLVLVAMMAIAVCATGAFWWSARRDHVAI